MPNVLEKMLTQEHSIRYNECTKPSMKKISISILQRQVNIMNEELLLNLLDKLTSIDNRLQRLEQSTTTQLQKLNGSIDVLTVDQQEEVLATLQRIDAKMSAILVTQKINVEILRVFSGDSVQH